MAELKATVMFYDESQGSGRLMEFSSSEFGRPPAVSVESVAKVTLGVADLDIKGDDPDSIELIKMLISETFGAETVENTISGLAIMAHLARELK